MSGHRLVRGALLATPVVGAADVAMLLTWPAWRTSGAGLAVAALLMVVVGASARRSRRQSQLRGRAGSVVRRRL